MGTVTSYDSAAGRRWRVRYRKPDHSQTDKRGFHTKRQAELFLASVELKKATGEYVDPRASRVTIATLAEDWLRAKEATLKPSSYSVLKTSWRTHVEPAWGARTLADVRHSEVQAWVAELASRRSATVTIRAHGILAGVLDAAVRDRRLPNNPARNVGLPRKTKKARRYLTHHQVEALAIESGPHGTLIYLLAYTGLRWGEAVALRVHSVDLKRRRILVQANAPFVAGVIVPGTPKTHEKRSVPYPEFMDTILRDVIGNRPADDLLFPALDGGYRRPPSYTRGWFEEAKKRTRKSDPTFPTALSLHDLRHTAASLAISAGASVLAVQRMLGHASAAMTLDTYSDLFEGDLDKVAQHLNEARATALIA